MAKNQENVSPKGLRRRDWTDKNDKTIDIKLDYQRLQGKSYNIDFTQIKTEKVSDEEIKDVLSSEQQITKQLQEKAKKESIKEEKTGYKEDNVVGASIEQLLDYEAKKLSDTQSYAGCIVFNVKDRLQEMIKMKGKDYAMNYMNEHWPKIDLSKVLQGGISNEK